MEILKNPSEVSWNTIDWLLVEQCVFKQQKKIYKASKVGNIKLVRQLQDLLCKSTYAKWLAIRQVTQIETTKTTIPLSFDLINSEPCFKRAGSKEEKNRSEKVSNAFFLLSSIEKDHFVSLLQFPPSKLSFQKIWLTKVSHRPSSYPIATSNSESFSPVCKKRLRSSRFVTNQSENTKGDQVSTKQNKIIELSVIWNQCLQNLLRLVMEPEWEAKFETSFSDPVCETNIKRASTFYLESIPTEKLASHAVLKTVRDTLQKGAQYFIYAESPESFDKRNLSALLKKVGMVGKFRQTLKYILLTAQPSQQKLYSLLVNIAFYGLEPYLEEYLDTIADSQLKVEASLSSPAQTILPRKESLRLIKYATKTILFHSDRRIVLLCQFYILEFLSTFGLNYKLIYLRHSFNQTSFLFFGPPIYPLLTDKVSLKKNQHFEFFGFQIQQFKTSKELVSPKNATVLAKSPKLQTRIWPSQVNCNSHQRTLHNLILSNQGLKLSQEALIHLINPIIGEWSYHYGNSDAVFFGTLVKMDFLLDLKLKKWALKKTGSLKTGIQKYWIKRTIGGRSGYFCFGSQSSKNRVVLKSHTEYLNFSDKKDVGFGGKRVPIN
jgi:hypothetical protein